MEKYYIVVIKTGYPMGVCESARDAWTHAITSMHEPFDIGTPNKIDSAISYLQREGFQVFTSMQEQFDIGTPNKIDSTITYLQREGFQVFRVLKIEEDKNELLEKT